MQAIRYLIDEIKSNWKVEVRSRLRELIDRIKDGFPPFYGVLVPGAKPINQSAGVLIERDCLGKRHLRVKVVKWTPDLGPGT